jgi:hypothetical protein
MARQLPRDEVVLAVCLAGARRQWINGTNREAERRRKLELTGVVIQSFRCTRAKLGRLGSTRGSRWCSRSTGLG